MHGAGTREIEPGCQELMPLVSIFRLEMQRAGTREIEPDCQELMPLVSIFRLERDNWRCLELEPEKLNLMKEMEERINTEKKSWMFKVLEEPYENEPRHEKTNVLHMQKQRRRSASR